MTETLHLGLPFIEGSQAQKHVTHNEALRALDALVMLAAIDRDLTSPPSSPAEGDRYIVKAPGAGGFAGRGNQVATYDGGVWTFYPPQPGWTCYVADEAALVVYDGSAWRTATGAVLQNLERLGVGTTADAVNPLAAKLNNALFVARTVAEGGDGMLRYKLSKENAGKTASFLFQDNFSGRAEIGLTGDDDFHVKVSPDGSNWKEALVVDRTTGAVSMPGGVSGGTWGEPVASWTYTTDVASVDFTALGDYRELMIVGFNLQHNSASNQNFHMLLSADNGATFFNGASNYQRYGTASGSTALFVIGNNTFASTTSAAIVVHLFNFNAPSRATFGFSFFAFAGGAARFRSSRRDRRRRRTTRCACSSPATGSSRPAASWCLGRSEAFPG